MDLQYVVHVLQWELGPLVCVLSSLRFFSNIAESYFRSEIAVLSTHRADVSVLRVVTFSLSRMNSRRRSFIVSNLIPSAVESGVSDQCVLLANCADGLIIFLWLPLYFSIFSLFSKFFLILVLVNFLRIYLPRSHRPRKYFSPLFSLYILPPLH